MLNDVLAVCVAGDPGRGRAAAEAGRCYCRPMELLAGLAATEDEVPHHNDPRTAAMSTIHSRKFSTENSLPSLDVAGAQRDSRIALLKSKAMARTHPCQTHEVWFGRRFVVDPPSHQTPSLALASVFPVKKFSGQEMDGRTLKGGDRQVRGAGGKHGGYRSSGGRSGRC
jgi:hypothetical protein